MAKTKITISTDFAIVVIIIVAFALGFSFWLGSCYEDYKILNPQIHMKKLNDMRNLHDGKNQMANPASMYCVEKKGKLEIRTAEDGGQVGYCKFSDGSECEEWAFMRGECEKAQQPEQRACTMEAKLCNDGSSVGRTGPNCEFSPCPEEK